MDQPLHINLAPDAVLEAAPDSTRTSDDARSWSLVLRVIDLARGLIVSENPFLSSAIGLLNPKPATLDAPFACDGRTLFVDVGKVLATFSHERTAPVHDLTHVLLHCLLLHPFVGASVDGPSWDLAADVTAELLTAEVMGPREGERGAKIAAVRELIAADLGEPLTAERLYHALAEGAYANARGQWASLFYVDDHGLWPSAQAGAGGDSGQDGDTTGQAGSAAGPTGSSSSSSPDANAGEPAKPEAQDVSDAAGSDFRDGLADDGEPGSSSPDDTDAPGAPVPDSPADGRSNIGSMSEAQRSQAEETWSRAAKSMRINLETISRTRGDGLAGLVKELEVSTHQRIDYRSFLRQFAVEHEDMRLSDDEFDYVFYTYGLQLYHNMPLVEPLEYRHEKRIRDFVIVIDTSSSVSDKVVQEFVNTTFDVLSSEGGFFAQTNIHIIQADARVQSDAKITSLADLDRWRRNIKLYGFGGTDFRPAFVYVQQLRQQGEFDDLQGLIYFTDGWGIYPDRMPPYKCAFVFYDEDHRPELVPPWAIQVVLHPGQFESLSVY